MQNLSGRLAALDSSASAALDVIAYFDRLTRSRAGLEQVVRGAAVLSGVPARLDDPTHRIAIRVDAAGVRTPPDGPPDPRWLSAVVGGGILRLETDRSTSLVDGMVLERAAVTAELVIARVRGGQPAHRPDCAVVELVVDPLATPEQREWAARELGLTVAARARVVALAEGDIMIDRAEDTVPGEGRRGVGPTVPIPDLPRSAHQARVALRFAADGTAADPGPRVVHADDLGGLVLLEAAVNAGAAPTADLRALLAAAQEVPHLLQTLTTVVGAPSVRAAATELYLHHSTLQDRLDQAERVLGWSVRTAGGRMRLQLALAERLLRR
ncbi:helix-turn-helix domain-containing protein [Pseudonocardia sp. NPDC049154]|uniref:helix-turn-helix domain-containing protein n=1 Tax=Pseudonocardia sp. NPDC049154 TaxID=3155501 RepID=UPI0033D37F13